MPLMILCIYFEYGFVSPFALTTYKYYNDVPQDWDRKVAHHEQARDVQYTILCH